MSLLEGLGRYIAGLGLGVWADTGTYSEGDVAVTVERMPQTPARIIALTSYEGNTVPSGQSVDEPRVQMRVRGTSDPTWSRDRAKALYDAFHGLTDVTLPDGTGLGQAFCQGVPSYMGRDSNERHEHVVNVQCQVYNPSRLE